MNVAPTVTERDDGYIQDSARNGSVARSTSAMGTESLDLCAAPGGKATALAGRGAGSLRSTSTRLGLGCWPATLVEWGRRLDVLVADGRQPPFAVETFDAVLIDAPCSGLGVLRRRPDARWRSSPETVDQLVVLQQQLIDAAAPLVRSGGTLVYSVCTLTAAESTEHRFPEWSVLPVPDAPWRAAGTIAARLLPQDAGTDGMTIVRLRRP